MPVKKVTGFIEFIREHGVVGLAVGFVLGGSVSKLVTALVNDIVNPIIGILTGRANDLAKFSFKVGEANIMWGSFINDLINFIILVAVVYWLFKLLRLDKLKKQPESK